MQDILNKFLELDNMVKALTDEKTIENIIRAQAQFIRDKYAEITQDKDRFMEGLDKIEKQMIEEYTKDKKAKK